MVCDAELPDWLVRIDGAAPLLLVAPHGGRRVAASALGIDGERKVNDLHTAELTFELAARLGASAVVNRAEDRNRLDLNRVGDVRARAPWLFDLLLEAARSQIAAAGQATFFFIHGWNAIQPRCDVGIGARLSDGEFVPVRQGRPTVPAGFLPRIAAFGESCARSGIEVTVGDRYPAAGRENVLQIFTARFAEDADPRLRELARLGAAGRIAAVQLEFAVPLRWPGHLRSRLIEALDTLASDAARPAADLGQLDFPAEGKMHTERIAIDFHDGDVGVGGFAATERTVTGRRHGRLLLAIGARRLCLFTGEDASPCEPAADAVRCAGLSWNRRADGELHIAYSGPGLTFARTDPFLDLETGLSEADLALLETDLRWRPLAPNARLGRIEGRVRHDGWTASISAPAALEDGRGGEAGGWRERRALRVPLGADVFLSISARSGPNAAATGEVVRDGRVEPLLSGHISSRSAADGLTPQAWKIEAVSRSGRLSVFGQVTHAIPVVRPARDGKILTFFGLARFAAGERVGFGTFEESQRLGREEKGTER